MDSSNIGRVVYSKAGRDEGKPMIIINVLDEKYVLVCNGDLRKVEKPKKKKSMHLNFTQAIAKDIREKLISAKEVTNREISEFLQSFMKNKEV